LSNIDDAVQQFKDEAHRKEMVERTYEYVMDQHTYRHRIKALLKIVTSSARD
jgi:spore maturation protein CgeB